MWCYVVTKSLWTTQTVHRFVGNAMIYNRLKVNRYLVYGRGRILLLKRVSIAAGRWDYANLRYTVIYFAAAARLLPCFVLNGNVLPCTSWSILDNDVQTARSSRHLRAGDGGTVTSHRPAFKTRRLTGELRRQAANAYASLAVYVQAAMHSPGSRWQVRVHWQCTWVHYCSSRARDKCCAIIMFVGHGAAILEI